MTKVGSDMDGFTEIRFADGSVQTAEVDVDVDTTETQQDPSVVMHEAYVAAAIKTVIDAGYKVRV
jgi:hypothetical protein